MDRLLEYNASALLIGVQRFSFVNWSTTLQLCITSGVQRIKNQDSLLN
ncbi:MAG: hypothetical protein KAI83_16170 [Thiomargarita sp.]|nr:hypothetical protein [Thiomargarita sp.]